MVFSAFFSVFFFNDTATTEIYTLSLHDALPICVGRQRVLDRVSRRSDIRAHPVRSEEHTSELQSHHDIVCRLLLEKKKTTKKPHKKRPQNTHRLNHTPTQPPP